MVLEKTLESSLDSKEIKPVNPKGIQPWLFIGRTDAEAEALELWSPYAKGQVHWKRPTWWQRLRAGGEEGDRGWDSRMVSLTRWTWVWTNSRRWWRTGKPGMLQFMEFQRVEHNLVNEQGQPYLWEQHWYSWFQLCFAKLFKMVGKLAGAMS